VIRGWGHRREAAVVALYTEWAIQFAPQPVWEELTDDDHQKWREILAAALNRYNHYSVFREVLQE
jgi:hypothetical protein